MSVPNGEKKGEQSIMPMNKVVHAAQRAAFSAAIDSAIKAVRGKGPENMAEQAVKLVNLAQPLLAHRYPDADWDKVRAFVSDPGSKWMEYAYKAINEIDPHILKMNTLNLVYEGMFAGYNYVMELRRKYDCNMPWDPAVRPDLRLQPALQGLLGCRVRQPPEPEL